MRDDQSSVTIVTSQRTHPQTLLVTPRPTPSHSFVPFSIHRHVAHFEPINTASTCQVQPVLLDDRSLWLSHRQRKPHQNNRPNKKCMKYTVGLGTTLYSTVRIYDDTERHLLWDCNPSLFWYIWLGLSLLSTVRNHYSLHLVGQISDLLSKK